MHSKKCLFLSHLGKTHKLVNNTRNGFKSSSWGFSRSLILNISSKFVHRPLELRIADEPHLMKFTLKWNDTSYPGFFGSLIPHLTSTTTTRIPGRRCPGSSAPGPGAWLPMPDLESATLKNLGEKFRLGDGQIWSYSVSATSKTTRNLITGVINQVILF